MVKNGQKWSRLLVFNNFAVTGQNKTYQIFQVVEYCIILLLQALHKPVGLAREQPALIALFLFCTC